MKTILKSKIKKLLAKLPKGRIKGPKKIILEIKGNTTTHIEEIYKIVVLFNLHSNKVETIKEINEFLDIWTYQS